MPIDAVKIPQNVYIEDRIVGPLTLKQILIVGAGGGISYALWAMAAKAYGSVSIPLTVLVWIPCVISAAFAFVKINDLSMLRMCLLLLERMNKPVLRAWGPRQGITINIRTFHSVENPVTDKSPGSPNAAMGVKQQARLQELSSILDSAIAKPEAAAADQGDMPVAVRSAETEPMEETAPAEEQASALPVRPVDPTRIRVSSAGDGAPMDGIAPRVRSSLFSKSSPSR